MYTRTTTPFSFKFQEGFSNAVKRPQRLVDLVML